MDSLLRQEGKRQVRRTKSQTERTFSFIRPERAMRGLIGEIITRFERKGLILVAAKLILISAIQAQKLYEMHNGRPFFQEPVSHVTSGPVFVMVWQGPKAIAAVSNLVEATSPVNASPGTIRRNFALAVTPNAIHEADCPENAGRELSIFVSPSELTDYSKPTERECFLE